MTGYSAPGSTADPVTNFGSFKHFRDIYSPAMMAANERLQDDPDRPGFKVYKLDTKTPDAASPNPSIIVPKVRVYMPPGTLGLHMSTYTYFDNVTEQAAAYRFGQPPESTYDQFTAPPTTAFPDSTQLLRTLEQGVEWVYRVGPGVNVMPTPTGGGAIQGSSQGGYRTVQGGWMYINFLKATGDRVQETVTQVTVDQAAYEAWYQTAQWDEDGNPL